MKNGKTSLNVFNWVLISLVNFCVVALAGVTLRYKINFPLPSVNQKNLLHGHSHFAFVGWVSLVLMALMVHFLQQKKPLANTSKYKWIFWAMLLTSYGMLAGFVTQGYDTISITCTSISIMLSYVFIVMYWMDIKDVQSALFVRQWLKASMLVWAISSLGAIALAYLMINRIMIQDYYFSAIYFFLHFQYNGWFLFVCFALLFFALERMQINGASAVSKKLFWVMAITVVPAYILSILWLNIPPALKWIGNVAGVLQLLVLIYFIQLLGSVKKAGIRQLPKMTRILWIMASVAFIIKILLQLLSIIPSLSQYAFGYRPVIIGYLHLSFLGIISFFILGYIQVILQEYGKKLSAAGLFIFVAGVLLQEGILMIQGLEALNFQPIRGAAMWLLYCAVIMFIGLLILTIAYPRIRGGHREVLSS